MTGDATAALVAAAAAVVRPRIVGGRVFGDVGCALRTDAGNPDQGVCIDTSSGTGFCAEHAAIAAMVTAGETRSEAIVAVWKDDDGAVVVLPPCGRCREFIRQIDGANIDAGVVPGSQQVVALRELLPYHDRPA